jgi:hypothetical protein
LKGAAYSVAIPEYGVTHDALLPKTNFAPKTTSQGNVLDPNRFGGVPPAEHQSVILKSEASKAGLPKILDDELLAHFKPTASASLDALFSDGDRAGTKPNGFEA